MAISTTLRLTLKTILKLLSHDMFGPQGSWRYQRHRVQPVELGEA
jgi:hypothetical protein